ncbi:lipopolysaccharide kinase InaA family protein [Tundrisphaera sp. TA3]|uniref:lipopolysaccharide kinase InaA family protein n=1 Tax=Tundrisphaera sp. TA3 TaxID=3435775 RepID=UPI003EBD6802
MPDLDPTRSPTAPRKGPRSGVFRPPMWSWEKADDTGWWVRTDWSQALLRDGRLPLDEWKRDGRLRTVKRGPHRVVYRADLAEGPVYVKHFLVPNLRAKARQWFRAGKGRNEGRRAAKLEAIGVPTITPVALGERRVGKFLLENFLVTKEIPNTVPLDEFVERRMPLMSEARQGKLRRDLARVLADLTARLHDAGFVHNDFHPGNVLIRIEADDSLRLAVIDLDALRVARRLSWSDVRENLALLNHYFWSRCNRSDRFRFLKAYLKARSEASTPGARGLARSIEQATRVWAERLWRRWGRRCWGRNKYFTTYQGPNARAIASRDLDASVVQSLIADPEAPLRRDGTVILKESRTAVVAEMTLPVKGRPTRVIYKRFNAKKPMEVLLNLVRPSRAGRAWQAGQHLRSRGLPTPQNLAYIVQPGVRRWNWLSRHLTRRAYLLTIKAEPSVTLGDYAKLVLPSASPEHRRERIECLTLGLARLLRTLHDRSISDRDLKAANILIVGDPDGPEPELTLIDLVGVQLLYPLPAGRRLQNLARLQISLADVPGRTRTDSLRFLRAYLPWGLTPENDWKGIWRKIARLIDSKEERNRRRGRPIS